MCLNPLQVIKDDLSAKHEDDWVEASQSLIGNKGLMKQECEWKSGRSQSLIGNKGQDKQMKKYKSDRSQSLIGNKGQI